MSRMFNTLSDRIGGGFALMVVLLALTVDATLRQVANVRKANEQMETVRMPVVQASVQLLNGVNHSSAALRGWVFMRDSVFIEERRSAWENEIDAPLQELHRVLPLSSDPTATKRLAELVQVIDTLRMEQAAAENAANSRAAALIVTERSSPASRAAREAIGVLVEKQRLLMRADLMRIEEQVDLLNSLQWLLLVLGVAAAVTLAIVTTRAIVRPVSAAANVADSIASGDLDTPIDIHGTRELNVLGAALTSMRDALKMRINESQRHTWLGDGQRMLDDVLRGEKTIRALANDAVAALGQYVGAQVGAVYVMDETSGDLHLKGSYSLGGNAPAMIRSGEGVIGQAAMDGQMRVFDPVDASHLRVTSSLLDAPSAHVIVVPFHFENEVMGVVELGKSRPFTPEEQDFLSAAMRSVGIAVKAAYNRDKINDLLEETQRQSEELQVQQEELQQTNEELEEQAERLKVQQEELQVTNEELEEQTQAVAQRNDALEAARKEVERKARELEITSKYKSEFLANMSHELRTPLNSLLILSNHLAKNRTGNLHKDQVESANVIAKSGYDLLHLINDILDLSKVEAGKLDLHPNEVQAATIADDIRTAFTHMAQEKGLELQVVVEPGAPAQVITDHQRLGQVIKNLVSNAIKFTQKGKVSVTIGQHMENGWSIKVKDTGIGIPNDKLHLIFEAFHQVDGSTSRKFGGTGLGLSISRELVNLLGGRIQVESEQGKGSTFTLNIPAVLPDRKAASVETFPPPADIYRTAKAKRDPAEHVKENGERIILIIEDDASFANVLAQQALSRGFKALVASSGEEGLALVREHRPQAIMLDIDLPGIDGNTVLRTLKSDPELRHIPVHILSADRRTLEPIRAGAVEYLEKPVDQHQLDEAFKRIGDLVDRKMKNLLIVEDNPDQRLAIRRLIGNGDVKCLEASNAEEGLEMMRKEPVDCIVLDLGLPDISGARLLKYFKDGMGNALPPIIVYTGKELSQEENDELRMYAETIIVKGIRSEERLLDETALFLHRAVKDLPQQKRSVIMELHDPDAVFNGRTVLLVDDDMRNIFALNKILSSKGINVIRAENGRVALEQLEKAGAVDMVLMDIMMPEMDGFECMRAIRAKRKWADLPIIALTAKAMKEDKQKCIDAGANDYISKPIDEARLFSMMRIWMQKEPVQG